MSHPLPKCIPYSADTMQPHSNSALQHNLREKTILRLCIKNEGKNTYYNYSLGSEVSTHLKIFDYDFIQKIDLALPHQFNHLLLLNDLMLLTQL